MRRRELIAIAGTGLVAWPLVARAQQQPKSARIGYLSFGDPAANSDRVETLRAGLHDLGYVEGKNLVIEFRWAPTVDELNQAAAELVRMKVDIIFATSSTESEPARRLAARQTGLPPGEISSSTTKWRRATNSQEWALVGRSRCTPAPSGYP